MDIMKAVEATMKKAGVSTTGNDAKYFTTNRKGENHELREELRSPQRDKKKDAVKKVIANMTVGKDVSTLFTDVLNCIQTGMLFSLSLLTKCTAGNPINPILNQIR